MGKVLHIVCMMAIMLVTVTINMTNGQGEVISMCIQVTGSHNVKITSL